jgi:predicted transcriptional regulator
LRGFGDLEAVVMDQLWSLGGSATVREVFERLAQRREIAYTTALSTMDNLYRKGHLTRDKQGKAHRYHTVASRAEHTAAVMGQVLSGEPDSEAVLTHFVERMSERDLARLREVLARRAPGSGR